MNYEALYMKNIYKTIIYNNKILSYGIWCDHSRQQPIKSWPQCKQFTTKHCLVNSVCQCYPSVCCQTQCFKLPNCSPVFFQPLSYTVLLRIQLVQSKCSQTALVMSVSCSTSQYQCITVCRIEFDNGGYDMPQAAGGQCGSRGVC